MKFPKALTSILNDTLESYNLIEEAKRYEALTNWAAIVGEKLASVSAPERIKGSSLIVRVTSSVWRYELSMRSGEILDKIQDYTGARDITEIIWR